MHLQIDLIYVLWNVHHLFFFRLHTDILVFLTPIWLVILMKLICLAICGYFSSMHASSLCKVVNWLLLKMRFLLLNELLRWFCFCVKSLHWLDRDWAFGQWLYGTGLTNTLYNDSVFNSDLHLVISVVQLRCLSFDRDVRCEIVFLQL